MLVQLRHRVQRCFSFLASCLASGGAQRAVAIASIHVQTIAVFTRNHSIFGTERHVGALGLTTPAGRAMAGLLAIFEGFEREIPGDRTRAGMAQTGKRLGRPVTAGLHATEIRKMHRAGVAKVEIARRLEIGRSSVYRILSRAD